MVQVHAVVDRIEDGKIVMMAEEIKQEFVRDEADYPRFEPGDWVLIALGDDGEIITASLDGDMTERKKAHAQRLRKGMGS